MGLISKVQNRGISILSIDAKDIYDSNHQFNGSHLGYNIRDKEGELKLNKFINSLDYSLDQIKLRQVHRNAYRNNSFSFFVGDKEYTQSVINVTFKYSYKQYNQITKYDARLKEERLYYVRAGYTYDELTFNDRLAFKDNVLAGVCVDALVNVPVSEAVLGDVFYFDNEEHVYKINNNKNETLKSGKDLRFELYENGFYCDGIKYVRFKRSSGSSRVGKCLFIDETLYSRMNKWAKCGIKLKQGQALDLAGWEAYISLTLSSIIDTLALEPKNILLIDDYESTFTDTMMAVDYKDGWLTASPQTTEISNSIWDGQSLLDSSAFEKYPDKSMLLLRTRFFKSACFNTNIQQFFEDNDITEVSQLNGITTAEDIHDIKLITTPSSIKYLKFGEFKDWLDQLESDFGIVKYDKPTYFFDGTMVQTHYQLLNTLHMSKAEVKEFLKPSKEYYGLLDSNPTVFRHFVGCKANCIDVEVFQECFDKNVQNDLSYYLLGTNKQFSQTKIYDNWKKNVLRSFKSNICKGHVLVEGTYATLFGNPYEMLQSSIGQFKGESILGVGNIYCPMFEDGQELLGSRSPHVAAGNILVAKNKRHPLIDKYFNLSHYIVCINSIKENILERLSGADMDSDTMLLTSNELLVRKAKEHYEDFLVPTKLVPSRGVKRYYTEESKADLDHTTADNRIGEIVNLSQELNTLMWHRINNGEPVSKVIEEVYPDIAKLDVMSNIEIDRAKREYEVDCYREMKVLRDKYLRRDKKKRKIKPFFFAHISKLKGYYDPTHNHYKHHDTTMDYLQDHVIHWRKSRAVVGALIPLHQIFKRPNNYNENYVRTSQAQRVFDFIRTASKEIHALWSAYAMEADYEKKKCLISRIDELSRNRAVYLSKETLNNSTIHWMLQHIEDPENADIESTFMKLMFGHPTKNFRRFLYCNEESVPMLVRHPEGKLRIFGHTFASYSEV